ncbi:MAG: 7-cyano-7-deazaguanine synthase QueC [Bdellovibrionales bacterium]|nr:7-cyano-7-deazaguanine synthase QueC [Bdellovibrionales bacterium]
MYDALILLSGGLDSSVNLYKACAEYKKILALSFNYGQKAASQELKAASKLCKLLLCDHQIHNLDFFKSWTQTSLINSKKDIPTNIKLTSKAETQESAKQVWIPNRNGVFLNVAASLAESLNIPFVYVGFNKEEAETFPDNSIDYLNSVNKSFKFSTLNKVQIKSYTKDLCKKEIYKLGVEIGVPVKDLWPCYFGGEKLCGECESCLRFFKASV